MQDTIGQDAGRVWNYLQTNGQASATKIGRDCALDAKAVQRAIGWLAREDKLLIARSARGEVISLK